MKMRWLCSTLLLAVGLSGCGGKVDDTEPVVDTTTRLGDSIDVKLSDWLELPRKQLADMAKESHDRLETTLKTARTPGEEQSVALLDKLRMPLTVPVLGEAVYSDKLGFSLPPYVKEGARDGDLALHLARHGDVDAALKLVDPENAAVVEKLESYRASRNYPVEWTRLVGLTLQEAEHKMARGDIEGATELVLLHRQLRDLLDKKAAAGQLGAVLLPLGQRALRDAVTAWREGENKFPAVAEEVERTLKDWGAMPVREPGLAPGAGREVVNRFFSTNKSGTVLAVTDPLAFRRLLDLQSLPIVQEGLIAALAWFDDQDKLGEVWFVYRYHIGELFPDAVHLAHYLVELGLTAKPAEKVDGLSRRSYTAGKLVYDYTLMPRCRAMGALLRVAKEGAKPIVGRLPERPFDFGAVNLARSFESMRYQLAPREASSDKFELKQPEALAQVKLPMGIPAPATVTLDRVAGTDLVGRMAVGWPTEENLSLRAIDKLCIPLWLAYGASRMEAGEHHLILSWDQGVARASLWLPDDQNESPLFIVEDTRGTKDVEGRLKAAGVLDEEVRKARWESEKPVTRLPRFLQWAELSLGLPRDQAVKNLKTELKSRAPIKTADGSVSILFTSNPPAGAQYHPLQMVLRFGTDDKLAEVRIRYQESQDKATAAHPKLLDVLTKAGGEPETVLPAPWVGLWTDMPVAKNGPICRRWRDDRTVMTYQADSSCTEVVLTDCPRESPRGAQLKKLEACPRGLDGCKLGDTREELLKRWRIDKPTTTGDGGLIIFQPKDRPYDLAVVYFENGKVDRILARQRTAPLSLKEDFTSDLQRFWSANTDRLGVVRRIDWALHSDTRDPTIRGYSWNDDRTRVHAFVEQTKEGWRLFTEWRDWPIAPSKEVAKKP
jgi:hypothetical protein